jgi:hypothetical protein
MQQYYGTMTATRHLRLSPEADSSSSFGENPNSTGCRGVYEICHRNQQLVCSLHRPPQLLKIRFQPMRPPTAGRASESPYSIDK